MPVQSPDFLKHCPECRETLPRWTVTCPICGHDFWTVDMRAEFGPRRRSSRRGLWTTAGIIAVVSGPLGLIVFLYAARPPDFLSAFGPLLLLGMIWTILLIASVHCFRLAVNEARETAVEAMHRDRRQPILYLRDFRTDGGPESAYRGDENQLAQLCSRLGPTVALGHPDDTRQPAGFARLYMSNDEWRLGLNYLLDRSRLVIINPLVLSDSLKWEISRCIERALNKVVILTWDTGFDYSKFRALLNGQFPHGLPPDPALSDMENPSLSIWREIHSVRYQLRTMPLWEWLVPPTRLTDGVISFDREGHGRRTTFGPRPTMLSPPSRRAVRDHRRRFLAFCREMGIDARETTRDRIERVIDADLENPLNSWILGVPLFYFAMWLARAVIGYRACHAVRLSECRWWIPPFFG